VKVLKEKVLTLFAELFGFLRLCLRTTPPTRRTPAESMTWREARLGFPDKILAMISLLRHFLGWMVSARRSHEGLVLENLALSRQLLALDMLSTPWRIVISGNHRACNICYVLKARLMCPMFILSMSLISKAFAPDSIFGRDT
jgi:hypothetical protein